MIKKSANEGYQPNKQIRRCSRNGYQPLKEEIPPTPTEGSSAVPPKKPKNKRRQFK